VLARTIFPDEIVTAQLWEKEQELLEENRMEERSQTENNESIPNDENENVPSETIIGGDEGITNLTSNRNGDVKFRNGSSHVNNGYEHTEM
jgi:hypothetical protein